MVTDFLEVAAAERIACAAAAEIAELVRGRQHQGRAAVLALPAGTTPRAIYAELVRLHREEGLSFANVVVFALDEYLGLPSAHPQTFRHFFERELFAHVDLPAENANVLDGDLHPAQVDAHCRDFERAIQSVGGLDLALLGLGRNGHVAFNEPGSPGDGRTRRVHLDIETRALAAPAFGGLERVPTEALTMGLGTIRSAGAVRLVATGASKRTPLARFLDCPSPTESLPVSWLAGHPDLRVWADTAAVQS